MITQESRAAHAVKLENLRDALRKYIIWVIESSTWDMSKERDRIIKQQVAILASQLNRLNTFEHPYTSEEDYAEVYKWTSDIVEGVRAQLYDRL